MNKHFKFPFWNPEIEQAVEDFMKSIHTENTKDFGWSWTRPLANIVEFTDKFQIQLAAPGLVKSDFNLSMDQNILKVEVDKAKPEINAKKHKHEFAYNKFNRQFKISDDVNKDGISAVYEAGILTITLLKKVTAQPESKTINVN